MKPADFAYEKPTTLAEAITLMGETEREPMALAGGQSLMPMMNFRVARPELLVDLGGIDGLAGIARADEAVRIGAMTRYSALERSDLVSEHLPLLAKALPHIAHSAVRNRGTIGGSLALADPAAEMPAVALVLEARLHAAGPNGERDIEADSFFLGAYDTALEDGELLTAVSFPVAAAGDRFGFHEIARRHGDYAMAGAVVALRGGAHRVALFGIGDGAMRATDAEAALDSDAGDHDRAAATLDALDISGDGNGDEATKRHLARVALRRALKEIEA